MGEKLAGAFITANESIEFFDIQGIDHEYRAKITLPARDAEEINNIVHYCHYAWDSEKQIYFSYQCRKDELPRKARITDIAMAEDTLVPMITLTVILNDLN
ncbi:hypothetical protein KKE48_02405 [Patescibacteria group bacterium]|nr:hypothetical protein [Patescibacteria group bacterium]